MMTMMIMIMIMIQKLVNCDEKHLTLVGVSDCEVP